MRERRGKEEREGGKREIEEKLKEKGRERDNDIVGKKEREKGRE